MNDYIDKSHYLDQKKEIIHVFPKVDDFVQLIKSKGQGPLLYAADLRRAISQICICPALYNLVGFSREIKNKKTCIFFIFLHSFGYGIQIQQFLFSIFDWYSVL